MKELNDEEKKGANLIGTIFTGLIVVAIVIGVATTESNSASSSERQVRTPPKEIIVTDAERAEMAMEKARKKMYDRIKADADAKGLRLPIETRTSRVYVRVKNYQNDKVIVRFPFTYGSQSTIQHSYLFSIDYNGNILEILDIN